MRKRFFAAALGVVMLVTACGGGSAASFNPRACILASEGQVQKATGNKRLELVGNTKDDDLGGSFCTYRDARNHAVVWRFATDPVSLDAAKQRRQEDYDVHSASDYVQLSADVARNSYVMATKGRNDLRGIFTKYPDSVITVFAPKGATLDQLVALRAAVKAGFDAQAAAAIAGQ